ncbi:MAG: RagB/SusD family nutrient uptake outer membrane protein, partial [Bacteroides sp.]
MTTKINKIIIFVGILISSLFLNSCDSYLDRQPDDALTIEMIFQKRATTQKYLISVYSYIIEESRSSFTTPYIGASDEASISYPNRGYTYMNNGSWSPDGPPYQEFWDQYYQGIREASFFMQKVGTCPELTSEEISQWTAEARFIRAFLYASMMRLYGPVILTGNDPVDFTNADLNKERATWDECVNYVCQELNEVAAILPEKQDVYWAGKPTKGAALAVKARLLLYSARPLFNGNSMYKDMISTDGKHLFSVEKDAKKWELAAQANKEVIDLNYQLYKDDLRDPIKSYQGIYLKLWNEELIWARAISGYE